MLSLPCGDVLSLEWLRSGAGRLAVLGHGMEGSSRSGYIRALGHVLWQKGWDVLAWNLRGCGVGGGAGRGWYHSGQTEDLDAVLHCGAVGYKAVAIVGFSLGGNLLLKYLGEGSVHPAVCAAVAVSAPLHLGSSAGALDERLSNRLYLWNFVRSFRARIARHGNEKHFFDRKEFPEPRSIREFDEWYTAPLHGFADALSYWKECSAVNFLPGIRVPCLILSARDDPFLTTESFPAEFASKSDRVWLETPAHGGHVAFLDLADGLRGWWELRVSRFLETQVREVL